MRRPRLKLDSNTEEACYHCISRIVGGEWLLGDQEKQFLRKQLWGLATMCGVEVLTYTLMSNHYHILLRVPIRREVSDEELVQLYEQAYAPLNLRHQAKIRILKADFARKGSFSRRWRERQLKVMFDVSEYNKLLKMNFTNWYNNRGEEKRIGTVWAERFKSLLIETGDGLRRTAAYIDLNCVRAGITRDPGTYKYCGFAEALFGNMQALRGLESLYLYMKRAACEEHRTVMMTTLSSAGEQKAPLSPEEWEDFVKTQGKLPLGEVLRSKIRYFVYGVILGSEEFVRTKSEGQVKRRNWAPRALSAVTAWEGLHVFCSRKASLVG